jgi:PleD family two-component response regulator
VKRRGFTAQKDKNCATSGHFSRRVEVKERCGAGSSSQFKLRTRVVQSLHCQQGHNIGDTLGNEKSILIVDDEVLYGEMVRRQLALTGHKLSRCHNSADVVINFTNYEFNVILSHKLIHAGMNGAELSGLMRDRYADSFIFGYNAKSDKQ